MKKKDIKILIIDDNEDILFALSAICDFKGWKSITATRVVDGIQKFKDVVPDIVLIDYHMPVINGIVGVQKIRELSKEVPIIVLTVEEKQEIADAFMEVGASDFALKPIKAPDLISRINVHLKWIDQISSRKNGYRDYAKGINIGTLNIIEDYMTMKKSEYTISKIAKDTGLAYQTVHRYLQHLISYGVVVVDQHYGKVGRPKQVYRWDQ